MWFNSFLAQRLTEERMKDVQREAKQARLARAYRHQRLKEVRDRERRRMKGWDDGVVPQPLIQGREGFDVSCDEAMSGML